MPSWVDLQDFPCQVAAAALMKFKQLPKKGKPLRDTEWTPLSAIIQHNKEDGAMKVVALGTGSKCIGQSKVCKEGWVVKDSHAEIIARREFVRYLLCQLKLAVKGASSIFTPASSEGTEVCEELANTYSVRPEVSFHFFSTQIPCGDAAIFPQTHRQEDAAIFPQTHGQEDAAIFPQTHGQEDAAIFPQTHGQEKECADKRGKMKAIGDCSKSEDTQEGEFPGGGRPRDDGWQELNECDSETGASREENNEDQRKREHTPSPLPSPLHHKRTKLVGRERPGCTTTTLLTNYGGESREMSSCFGVCEVESPGVLTSPNIEITPQLSPPSLILAAAAGNSDASTGGDGHRTGAKCVLGGAQDPKVPGTSYHTVGAFRTKPGRGDPTLSMSCSDKILRWNVLGCQGALLSHFISHPVFFATFTFSDPLFDREAFCRAIFRRLTDTLCPEEPDMSSVAAVQKPGTSLDGFGSNHFPADGVTTNQPRVFHCKCLLERLKEYGLLQTPGKKMAPGGYCVSPPTCEVLVQGLQQGANLKLVPNRKASVSICKHRMFEEFIQFLESVEQNHFPLSLRCWRESFQTYSSFKRASKRHSKARTQFLSICTLWLTNADDDDFMV